jgi:hypothetical protein
MHVRMRTPGVWLLQNVGAATCSEPGIARIQAPSRNCGRLPCQHECVELRVRQGATPETHDDASGQASELVEVPAPVAPLPAPVKMSSVPQSPIRQAVRARRVEAKNRETHRSRTERNASSGAQAESRNLAAAFPGYATLH